MEYIKKNLGAYNLHIIKTDKFKTIDVRVSFHRVINKNEITERNILSDMLMQSSTKYKTKRDLTIKAQDLYAADLQVTNSRLGNYINTDFYLSVLNDKYTEKGNFVKAIEFLSEVMFNPDITNGGFDQEKLDIVKNTTRSFLNSLKEDARGYSILRMNEAMDKTSPTSYRMMGYIEDLDKITTKSLYEHYLSMIKSDLLDIFVIGDVNTNDIMDLIKKNFKVITLKKQKVGYMIPAKRARSRKLIAKEVCDNTQSNIAIGCRLYGLNNYEMNYPFTLFNIIFGGSTDSKLFQVVREKHSLCYTIFSRPNKLDNILIISAGINKKNYRKSVALIEKCLKEMKCGKFKDNDIKMAKEYCNTAFDETEDSPSKLITNYLMMELIGTDELEVRRRKMAKVGKSEIVKVAKKVNIDTIFCLEGAKDERN